MLNRLTKLAVVAVVLAVMGSWGCSASTSPSDPGEDEKKPSQQPVDEKQPEPEPDKPKTPRPPPEPLPKIALPAIDAQAAAKAAIDLYDKDGNGTIGGEELKAAPALAAAMADLDEDQDEAVSQEEIVARITAWQDSKIALTNHDCQVMRGEEPLIGATVTLVPEAFLGSEVQTASGITDEEGIAEMSIADLPEGVVGVHLGFYRVRVSKLQDGKELIPAKYNTETTLGEQVSEEDWDVPLFELAGE